MLQERIRARILWAKGERKFIRDFGLPLWVVKKAAAKIYPRNREIGLWLNERRIDITLNYITKNYGDCVNIEPEESLPPIEKECPVWTCWWQGEESAPDIIKACIQSIREHCGNHLVHVITWENYSQYVEIPEVVMKRYKNGEIMSAHMADLLRCKLLTQYGGIWCDATIFMTEDLNASMFDYSFYTIKHGLENWRQLELEPSKCYWRIFFMGTGKNNPIVRTCGDILERMLSEKKPLINYWTMDYIFLMLYRQYPIIKNMLDAVPYNNENPYLLEKNLGQPYSEQLWKDICNKQSIHKLSWKIDFPDKSDTIYAIKLLKK